MTDGQDWSAAVGNMYAMGSFAVMPGCTMYQYMGTSYTGERCVIDIPEFKKCIFTIITQFFLNNEAVSI